MEVSDEGDIHIRYRNKRGELHREDGPAVIYNDGTLVWYVNRDRHREDGPAVIRGDGAEWYINGRRHRVGAPAIIWANGSVEWWVHGEMHRDDGPAGEYSDGRKEWWFKDVEYTYDEWLTLIPNKFSCLWKEYCDDV